MSLLQRLKVKIRRVEEREKDYWVDMSLRELREGEVRYYHVRDYLTGDWLFKICKDAEMQRIIVKALKCPAGGGFAQLEGRTMLFQKGIPEGYYYDIISLSYIDEKNRLRRKVISDMNDVPKIIKKNFRVMEYEEVTGNKVPGKKLAVLCKENDEKSMILLFLIERAWPLSMISPETGIKASDLLGLIKELEKARLDEVYQAAESKLNIGKKDADMLLEVLEKEGLILRLEEYVKTKD